MKDRLSHNGLESLGVDRENNTLTGYIVAEAGDFKDGRGCFTMESLQSVCDLINAQAAGVKSHFGHFDNLGKFLGRCLNARLDGQRVRCDLAFDRTAMELGPGMGGKPYGCYVMDLAESDPGALNSSLVLSADKRPAVDPATGKKLYSQPQVWTPLEIFGSDIVVDGDAVHGGLLESDDEYHKLAERMQKHAFRLKIFEAIAKATK